MFISLMFGIIDGIKSSAFAAILPDWTARLPLAEQGGTADAHRRDDHSRGDLGSRSRTSGDFQRALTGGEDKRLTTDFGFRGFYFCVKRH